MKLHILYLIALPIVAPNLAFAQNLVPNPGFEQHSAPLKRLQYATFLEKDEFDQTLSPWKSIGYPHLVSLFSTKYKPQKWQEESGYSFRKVQPYTGHSMLRMLAQPKGGICKHGGSGYIQTRLLQPLLPGNVYSVSFRVFVPAQESVYNCPDYARHFGIVLSGKPLKLFNPECALKNYSVMGIDTLRSNAWLHVSYNISPAEPLEYLVIGGFYEENDPYDYENQIPGCEYIFFLDDIVVEKNDRQDAQAIVYPEVSADAPAVEEPPIAQFSIYFRVNSDSLTASSQLGLDSVLTMWASDRAAIFHIAGHADVRGNDNYDLSRRRAVAVQNYLQTKGIQDSRRFEISAHGSDSLIGDNNTEYERRLSRRVVIRKSEHNLPFVLYNEASRTADPDSACALLLQWLTLKWQDGMLLMHDPDLNRLHSHVAWKAIEKKVKAHYRTYKNPEAAYELDNLYFKDQRYRSLSSMYMEAKGSIPAEIDRISNDTKAAFRPDSVNALEAMALLKKYGWLSAAAVGGRPASAVFYAVQHAEKPTQMKQILPFLEKDCKDHVTNCEYYAMMYDRLSVLEKGMQRYGTQYKADPTDPGLYRLAPLENPEKINTWRAELKLGVIDLDSSFRMSIKTDK